MDQNKTTQISLSIDVSMRLVDYNDKVQFYVNSVDNGTHTYMSNLPNR